MARHAFIIGGTGQIGRAIAYEFLGNGWTVTVAQRGTRSLGKQLAEQGAYLVRFDREKPGALAQAIGQGADAVIDTVAFTPEHAEQLLEIEGSVGAFAVISSASVYRDAEGRTLDEARVSGFPDFPRPISETGATVDPGPETYSTQKIALERGILDHARRPVTILRPCAIYGPGSLHPREWWFVKRMLDRRAAIPLAYRGESRFHTSAVANIAAIVRIAMETPGTRVLNAADPEAPTVAEIGAAIGACLGYRGAFVGIDDDEYPPVIGATPWSVPRPFVLDTSAAVALGYAPAGNYRHEISSVCDWLIDADDGNWRDRFPVLASYPFDLFDYAAEDAYFGRRSAKGA